MKMIFSYVVCLFCIKNMFYLAINTRFRCERVMDTVKDCEPWFGFEQEYFITDNNGIPLGWNKDGTFEDQGIFL